MRGSTRNSIGEMPIVVSASISSFTCIVPSWAAKAAPVRPGHDDGRHHGAHLPRHGDAHQVGDVDLGAELPELHGADEGQDQSDQKADQRDDGQRARAAVLDDEGEVAALEAGAAARERGERQHRAADESERLDDAAARPR